MLNCLKENKVVLYALIGLIIILLIGGITIYLFKKYIFNIVLILIAASVGYIGIFVNHNQDHIDKFDKCINKDKLAVIKDFNDIKQVL